MAKVILLAEDFDDDVAHLQMVFKKVGVANPVVIVHDGDEVVDYLEGKGAFTDRVRYPLPGILLLDLNMPRMGGFEVLEWLQGHPNSKEILVVVLTGNAGVWDMNRAYALGAHSFLVKPCHPEDLINLRKTFPEHWVEFTPTNGALVARKPADGSVQNLGNAARC